MYPFWIGSTVLLAGSIYVLAMPDKRGSRGSDQGVRWLASRET